MSKEYDQFKRLLASAIPNVTQSFYDSYVEKNTSLRARAGVKCYIIRRQMGRCCDWCASLAGIYEEGDAPDGIYQRHKNCKCLVTFRSEKGTYTDVWSKREFETQRAARIAKAEELAIKNKQYYNYDTNKKVNNKRFNSVADPMRDVLGAAESSNPQEIVEFTNEIKDNNVELIRREYEDLGYCPGLLPGQPGQLHISIGASYSAWCHEMRHMRDDKAAGWSGMRIFTNLDEQYRREQRAYAVEIELAEKMNHPEIAEKLRENLEKEKREIYDNNRK